MDTEFDLICATNINLMLNTAALLLSEEENDKKKRKYSSEWLLRREEEGFTHKLLKEIQCEDSKLYRNILRMTPAQFGDILERVRPAISKQDTTFRNCIGPAERLQLTLRYLATGETQKSLQLPFRIQQSTISRILKETIPALYSALQGDFLKFPASQSEWLQIASDFYNMWGFPNCIGAIDGKHCRIKPLKKAGSTYFNYKGTHSFILMAIADAHYRFVYVDVGVNGRVGDAGVWQRSDLKYAIEKKEVCIPSASHLPGTEIAFPYVLLADDAFALSEYMMKPYSLTGLTSSQEHFNYMLSRNRRVVENAFGILANRFQVLFAPIYRAPTEAIEVVLACVCLHNFLRTANINNSNTFDNISNQEINQIIQTNFSETGSGNRRQNRTAENMRRTLESYFFSIK